MRNLLIITLFGLLSRELAIAEEKKETNIKVLKAVEVTLPAFPKKMIEEDYPIRDLMVDNHSNAWLIGKTTVWHWNLKSSRVKKISLSTDRSTFDKISGNDGNSVFAAREGSIFKIELNPQRIIQFDNPLDKDGNTFGFTRKGKDFYWIQSSGVFRINADNKLTVVHKIDFLKPGDKVAYSPEEKVLWIARDNLLLIKDFTKKGDSLGIIHKASSSFVDIRPFNTDIMAATEHAVLKFGKNLKLNQSIPVEGTRKIKLFSISETAHTYFFDDGLFEVFDVQKKQLDQFNLRLEGKIGGTKMAYEAGYVGLIADGRPKFFKLSM